MGFQFIQYKGFLWVKTEGGGQLVNLKLVNAHILPVVFLSYLFIYLFICISILCLSNGINLEEIGQPPSFDPAQFSQTMTLKFQSSATPNCLIANLYGPVEGKRHDSAMLSQSQVLNQLQRLSINPHGDTLCVYGDPAYPLRPQL